MLRVSLRASRRLASVLVVAHTAAAATLIPLALALSAKLVCGMLVAVSLFVSLRRHALLSGSSAIREIELEAGEVAEVRNTAGEWRDARVLGSSYVSPALTVLNLRVGGSRFAWHVVIVPDSIDAETFRRLRVQLRWSYGRAG